MHSNDLASGKSLAATSMAQREQSALERLRNALGILDEVNVDLDLLTEKALQGSCQWLLQRQNFLDWVHNPQQVPSLMWITGMPGSGKSTLASFVINFLRNQQVACHYHVFQAGYRVKRTLSYLLWSIAFQSALSCDVFATRLLELYDGTGINFGQQKPSALWRECLKDCCFDFRSMGVSSGLLTSLMKPKPPEICSG
jgi:hypothetical protein